MERGDDKRFLQRLNDRALQLNLSSMRKMALQAEEQMLSSDDEVSMFAEFKNNLQVAQRYFALDEKEEEFSALYDQLDAHIEELELMRRSSQNSTWSSPGSDGVGAESSATAQTIFDDVDD